MNYTNVWEKMNALESVTSKICSAREILDCAIGAHQNHNLDKVEHLLHAVDEYLEYYLKEFDAKFSDAWQATVGDLRDVTDDGMRPWGHSDLEYQIANNKKSLSCDKDDPSPECQKSWNDFWEENYYPEEYKQSNTSLQKEIEEIRKSGGYEWTPEVKSDKVVKWILPVQQECIDGGGDYYINFPDDLLDAADLKEGYQIEWIYQGDKSYLLKKIT